MNYTKGEWELYTGHDGQFKDRPFILMGKQVIAEMSDMPRAEVTANAHLISAAPDMYEALKNIQL